MKLKIYFTLLLFFLIFNAVLLHRHKKKSMKNHKWMKLIADNEYTARKEPTLAARINKYGLEFLSGIADLVMNREFPKVEFPSIYFPITGGLGKGNVTVKDLNITKFRSPRFYFSLMPPDAVYLLSRDGAAKIHGSWDAEYTILATVTTSGWVEAILAGIESKLTIGTYGEDGHPQIKIYDCVASVKSLSVEIGGGVIPWLVNLFHSGLSEAIKETIHEQFCITAQTTLVENINAQLLTLPTHVEIYKNIFVDYSYTNDPIIESDNIVIKAFIDVTVGNQTCRITPEPLWIDLFASKKYMTNFWISNNVFQCLSDSIYRADSIQVVLDKDFNNGLLKTFLCNRCKFFEICLGKFFPIFRTQYPKNSYIDIHIHLAATPNINTSASGISIHSSTFMDFHLAPYKINPEILARLSAFQKDLNYEIIEEISEIKKKSVEWLSDTHSFSEVNIVMSVKPVVENNRIQGILKDDLQLSFTSIYSKIGDFHEKLLDLIGIALNPSIRIFLNGQLRNGLPIPLVEGIGIGGNPNVLPMSSGLIRVDANLRFVENKHSLIIN